MIQMRGFPIPSAAKAILVGEAFVSRGYDNVSICVRIEGGDEVRAIVLREVGASYCSTLPSVVNMEALRDSIARIEGEVLIVPTPPMIGAFATIQAENPKVGCLFIGANGEAIVGAAYNGRLLYVPLIGAMSRAPDHTFCAYQSWSLVWRDGSRQEVLASFPVAP